MKDTFRKMKNKNKILNNKGIAISGVMYLILLVSLLLVVGTLKTLQNRKIITDKLKSDTIEELTHNQIPTSVEISIVNAEQKYLTGARVIIKDTNGNIIRDLKITSPSIVPIGLPVGKYTIEEIEPPLGYQLNSTPQTFEVIEGQDTIITPIEFKHIKIESLSGYTTDGLLAWYDAEYNTFNGTSDTTATVWKDLTGNYDLEFTGESGYIWGEDKSLVFQSGGENYMSGKFSFPADITGFTIYAVFSTDGSGSSSLDNYSFGFTDDNYNKFIAGGKITSSIYTYNNYYLKNPLYGTATTGSKNFTSGEKIYMTITVETHATSPSSYTSINIYQNGTKVVISPIHKSFSGFTQGDASTQGISMLHLGGIPGSAAKPYNTHVHQFMVYDKVLSDAEMEQNYNKSQERFVGTEETGTT